MSVATDRRAQYRRIANRARAIPGQHGLRTWRVYLDTATWSGSDHPGDGSESETSVELLENGQPPKCRLVSEKRVALGLVDPGSWEIGPITPVVGTTWATALGTALTAGQGWRVRIVHEEASETIECSVTDVQHDRALRIMITAKPVR